LRRISICRLIRMNVRGWVVRSRDRIRMDCMIAAYSMEDYTTAELSKHDCMVVYQNRAVVVNCSVEAGEIFPLRNSEPEPEFAAEALRMAEPMLRLVAAAAESRI
jgi:hypothetical protein